MPLINITDEGAGIVHAALGGLMLDAQKRVALQPLFAPSAIKEAPNPASMAQPVPLRTMELYRMLADALVDVVDEADPIVIDGAELRALRWLVHRISEADPSGEPGRSLADLAKDHEEPQCATCAEAVETRVAPCDECGAVDEEDSEEVAEFAQRVAPPVVTRWQSGGLIWSNIAWTHADQDEAFAEGWRLYQGDDGKLEIQCDPIGVPGPVPFNGDDAEAAEHVADVAAGTEEASPVYVDICKRALALVGRDPMNPEEAN